MTKTILALVGCGESKQEQPAEAKTLYTSSYFHKKRRWAEGCDEWRILSAEYGLLHPTEIIDPYDTVLSERSKASVREWAEMVASDLKPLLAEVDVVVILAGMDYFMPIASLLREADVEVQRPFQGKRIGEQMQWLTDTSPPNQSTIEKFE